jgi:hypothetical protein
VLVAVPPGVTTEISRSSRPGPWPDLSIRDDVNPATFVPFSVTAVAHEAGAVDRYHGPTGPDAGENPVIEGRSP